MTVYTGSKLREISFPLGGIGTGCVGLAGNGRLVDWEILNHPGKMRCNGFTHLLVRAEKDGKMLDARVLQGDYIGSGIGGETTYIFRGNGGFGYGMGPYRGTMAGLPHFKNTEFCGEFPFAQVRFSDECFPGKMTLKAYNPFIPLDSFDSSLPAAFFEVEFENDTAETLDYSALFSLNNLFPFATTVNKSFHEAGVHGIYMHSSSVPQDDMHFGSLCLITDAKESFVQDYWYRAAWFDSLETYWHEVNTPGPLKARTYTEETRDLSEKIDFDGEDMGTVGAYVHLAPGEKKSVRFIMTWYLPNCAAYWNFPEGKPVTPEWKNWYATVFDDAKDCALYASDHQELLYKRTMDFKETLFRSTLPEKSMEAVSANLSILKSATVQRLEDGSFYGWEGCNADTGCCEGSCSHVWNYAYALPYLFPELERSMRDLEYRYSMRDDGSVSFRLKLPVGSGRYDFRACVDGQMGGVIKTYRDFRMCGDIDWLKGIWPDVKKSLEFAWCPTNEDKWDADMDGVMEGRQHHTLDMELFGPSSWLNGFYLAALKAAAEMARILGYTEDAEKYQRIFENGKKKTDEELFNGEYYIQNVDLTDRSILERLNEGKPLVGKDTIDAYWNEETGEIKYQIANGSCIDQVIGGWHAGLAGLGEIFDPEKTVSALRSVYTYNFKKSFRNEFNPARLYAYDDEGGVKICDWPKDAVKPAIPITYAAEVFCGMEYAAASYMIMNGLLEEGFEIVDAIRDRFDGEKRNPWNEFECGSNYARSMASFALLPAVLGYTCDLYGKKYTFLPKQKGDIRGFFSCASGWGEFIYENGKSRIEMHEGKLAIHQIVVPEGTFDFEGEITVSAGETLNIS